MELFPAVLALTLLSISPGLDTLLTVRNAARGGVTDGVVTSFGICSGLFVHALLSALGISVLLMQSAMLFGALKLVGAAYLIWLGWGSLRQALRGRGQQRAADSVQAVARFRVSHWRCVREGLLSNLLNPKTIIFYMAFLPQFIDPAGAVLPQALLLAGLHFVIAMSWQSLLAVLTCRMRAWVRLPVLRTLCHAVTGLVMVALGVRLALARI
ncbi:LysE family translocator [Marinobacterium rhizophilum]|uniref:LysE family translocator n=1 Tax=Marinobacterium rhizophilum TaxID=420402 RepID=A0ABY5HN66_9GAMM|nr:LysE family translocator [Marinobacterium rhizophilum]UTW13379.1 LysE family translocator [Marinobacterium rhizophilum]